VVSDHPVSIELSAPGADQLGEIARLLKDWQHDGAPVHLHPGDLGWHWRFGVEAIAVAAAAALRGLGASSAIVVTPSSNIGAVATYTSAGFQPLPEARDLRRST
jgi:hypothetical protein